jgi:branched-chain amino acid transport system ATP-binding protein
MGLAPLVVEELYRQVAELTSTGVSILVVEQFAGFVLDVADQVAVLVNGEIRAAGPPAEMAERLQGAYLGAPDPMPMTPMPMTSMPMTQGAMDD